MWRPSGACEPPTTRHRRPRRIRASYKGDARVRQRTEKSLAQYEERGVDELTMDLWVDAERPHAGSCAAGAWGGTGQLDLTITFLDIGKPVNRERRRPPPTPSTWPRRLKEGPAAEPEEGPSGRILPHRDPFT